MGLKIGIVTEYYYPLLGGVTENVCNTKKTLQRAGHEVKVITSNCGDVRSDGSRYHDPPSPDVIRIGRSLPVYSNGSLARVTVGRNLKARIARVLEEEEFDLLHCHSPIVPMLPLLALAAARCPVVGTFHTYFDRSLAYAILKDAAQRRLDRLDGQIAVSQSCIDALSRYFRLRARIIPNGVDTDQFNPSVPRLEKFDDGKLNLLFVSRFDPRNGLALMLRAFRIVKSAFPDVRLIVVGDGMLRFYYKQLVPKELARDVHFEGLIRDRRPSYYAACDVFCSPVMKASFGVTLLEAMAAGKPIVATENTGYKELLSPQEGFLVPQRDPKAFAETILRLLRDERLRRDMGANGRRKALRYSWDIVGSQIRAYYAEILGG